MDDIESLSEISDEIRLAYAGRWVAFLQDRVVGHGGTPIQALKSARSVCPKETPKIIYVPTLQDLEYPEAFYRIQEILGFNQEIYLIGGSVRDALQGRPVHDLDFVLARDPRPLANQVAGILGAAYYLMDDKRLTVRLIIPDSGDAKKIIADFAVIRGTDLEADIHARDFTLNAMAVSLAAPQKLLDPLDGLTDLRSGVLRACSQDAMKSDPLRIVRGIRQAVQFGFRISPETTNLMKAAVPGLETVSMERRRDELFRMLESKQPVRAIRALDRLGALSFILPELQQLKGVLQTPPHIFDVWDHTLHLVEYLPQILDILDPAINPDKIADIYSGLLALKLGCYRQKFWEHFSQVLNPNRSLKPLLLLAGLYHDIAKPFVQTMDETGRIRAFGHEQEGVRIFENRGMELGLSRAEIDRGKSIIRHHMRIHQMVQAGEKPSRRAVHRFFRDTGDAGVDIILLTLADVTGTYGSGLSQDLWERYLVVCTEFLDAWWNSPAAPILPVPLLNGDDLIALFNLKPGRIIGLLLEDLKEAQADGEVTDVDSAAAYLRYRLDSGEFHQYG